MNRGAMSTRARRFLAASLAIAALGGCGQGGGGTPVGDAPLAGADIGGPFELVDSSGKTVRWSDFDGKYRIVYFGYTYCPDACPFDVQRMVQGFNRFKEAHPELAAQVQQIFISIDPERDTPEKVGQFTRAFSNDLLGLTGTPEQVDRAADAFRSPYQKGEDAGGGSYLMDHSRIALLMGRNGEPIAPLPIDVADKGEAVAAELEKWVS
jgi:protein SCO1/2